MRRLARVVRGLVLAVMAAGGVLFAHTFGYALVVPSAHDRHELLSATGHAHLSVTQTLLGAMVIGAGALVLAHGFRVGLRGRAGEHRSLRREVTLVTGWQAGAFLGLELVERVSVGAAGPRFAVLLVVGLALQPVIAVVAVVLARVLGRVGEHLAQLVAIRRPTARRRGLSTLRPASWDVPARVIARAPFPPRGPPLLSVA